MIPKGTKMSDNFLDLNSLLIPEDGILAPVEQNTVISITFFHLKNLEFFSDILVYRHDGNSVTFLDQRPLTDIFAFRK